MNTHNIVLLATLVLVGHLTLMQASPTKDTNAPQLEGKQETAAREKRSVPLYVYRDDVGELDDDYHTAEKRSFGRLFGRTHGISGGRQRGFVLGGGYKFGKRSYGRLFTGHPMPSVLRGGWKFGKRQANVDDFEYPDVFEKRRPEYPDLLSEIGELAENDDGFEEEKRPFGHVLGGGFRFGKFPRLQNSKREYEDGDDDGEYEFNGEYPENNKRSFGQVIGGGFRFGNFRRPYKKNAVEIKREYDGEEFINDEDKRGFGHVIGGGFRLGNFPRLHSRKREEENETVDTPYVVKREYGSEGSQDRLRALKQYVLMLGEPFELQGSSRQNELLDSRQPPKDF